MALAGEKHAALASYRRFAERLERELGLEPLPATQALARAIEGDELTPPPAVESSPPAVVRNLPLPTTPFVGRDLELAEIASALLGSDSRPLTLVGPGGSGKSRLAIQLAPQVAPHFRDGAAFVPLAAVADAKLLATTIAGALSLSFAGQASPEEQLLRYLKNKEILLVLDNLEHLLVGTGLIDRILQRGTSISSPRPRATFLSATAAYGGYSSTPGGSLPPRTGWLSSGFRSLGERSGARPPRRSAAFRSARC